MYEMKAESKGLIAHGISICAGCPLELIYRNVLDVLGSDVTMVVPPGCSALFDGLSDECHLKVPVFQCNLENAAAIATGISRGYRLKGNDHTIVTVMGGDGATIDIGIQAISGIIERGEDVLYICYDNEAYMNTGIQGSSSTPIGAWSTTTPGGKNHQKKDLLAIAIAHDIPYCASASISHLRDLREKIAKGKAKKGPRLFHISCPCPTGWGFPSAKTVEIARKSVETGAWLLYEYEDGQITVNYRPQELKPISDYLSMQRRFRDIDEETKDVFQRSVNRNYRVLCQRAEMNL